MATYFCVEYGGSIYGCSTRPEEASAALARGAQRGVTRARIVTRKSRPSGQPPGWLTPFDERRPGR
jgi:hypothetical protein